MGALAVGKGSSSALNLFSWSPSTLIVVVGDTIAGDSDGAMRIGFQTTRWGRIIWSHTHIHMVLCFGSVPAVAGQSPRLIFCELTEARSFIYDYLILITLQISK